MATSAALKRKVTWFLLSIRKNMSKLKLSPSLLVAWKIRDTGSVGEIRRSDTLVRSKHRVRL